MRTRGLHAGTEPEEPDDPGGEGFIARARAVLLVPLLAVLAAVAMTCNAAPVCAATQGGGDSVVSASVHDSVPFMPNLDVTPRGSLVSPLPETDARKCTSGYNSERSQCAAICGGSQHIRSCTVATDPDTGKMTTFCNCTGGAVNPNLQVRAWPRVVVDRPL